MWQPEEGTCREHGSVGHFYDDLDVEPVARIAQIFESLEELVEHLCFAEQRNEDGEHRKLIWRHRRRSFRFSLCERQN